MAAQHIIDDDVPDQVPAGDLGSASRLTGRRRFRRWQTGRAPAGADAIEEALAELVLLREENARLKASRHQPPSFDRVVNDVRALPGGGEGAEDVADGVLEILTELSVLRESLLEVCRDLESALASVRVRLLAVSGEAAEAPGTREASDVGDPGDGLSAG